MCDRVTDEKGFDFFTRMIIMYLTNSFSIVGFNILGDKDVKIFYIEDSSFLILQRQDEEKMFKFMPCRNLTIQLGDELRDMLTFCGFESMK
ncbi:hypothetical protein D4R87_00200 [bacterium]|nr:MAG: hypothetical protein D4R87_00200 [bacterium]